MCPASDMITVHLPIMAGLCTGFRLALSGPILISRSSYDYADDSPLPVRHLDAFQLCQVGDLAKMEPLEEVDGVSESIVAQGQVIPADAIGAGDLAANPFHLNPADDTNHMHMRCACVIANFH